MTKRNMRLVWLHRLNQVLSAKQMRGLVLISLLCGLAWALSSSHPANMQPYHQAQRWIETLPLPSSLNEAMQWPANLQPAHWQPVALPDSLAHAPLTVFGQQERYQRAWFHWDYTPSTTLASNESVMIYVPRIMGGPYQVWVNGQAIMSNVDDWRMQWNRPLSVVLPLSVSHHPLRVSINVPFLQRMGYTISQVYIGPVSQVEPLLHQRVFWQTTMVQASTLVVTFMGLFALYFWWHRPHETPQLLLSLMALAWLVCNLRYVLDVPAQAHWAVWYNWLIDGAVSWVVYLVYLFAFRFDNRQYPKIERTLFWFACVMTLITLPIWHWHVDGNALQQRLNALVALLVTLMLSWLALRGGRSEVKWLCVAQWVCIAFGINDIALVEGKWMPDGYFLFPYGCVFIFGAFEYAVQRRYLAALQDQEHMSATLVDRLAERQSQLEASYQQLKEQERQHTLLLERQRMMADMHDGLGSSLVASLAMVEQGHLSQAEVAVLLRECLDDMRLMIDTLDPAETDLAHLLADLRHRLQPRLQAAGIRCDWPVHAWPEVQGLSSTQRLNLLRIVQESITNTLKHANAKAITLVLALQDNVVSLCIADDGSGFDPQQRAAKPMQRGLASMRRRAEQAGAVFSMVSHPLPHPQHGTSVTLHVPMSQRDTEQ